MNSKNPKVCQECRRNFDRVRLDQKFCTRKCRNDFYNRKERIKVAPTRTIDNILHSNRTILEQVGKKTTIDKLRDLGFNFSFITQVEKIKGKIYYGCYEFLYCYDGKIVNIYFNKTLKTKTNENV